MINDKQPKLLLLSSIQFNYLKKRLSKKPFLFKSKLKIFYNFPIIDNSCDSYKKFDIFIYEDKQSTIIDKISISDKNLFLLLAKYISFLNSTFTEENKNISQLAFPLNNDNSKFSLYMMINYIIEYSISKNFIESER